MTGFLRSHLSLWLLLVGLASSNAFRVPHPSSSWTPSRPAASSSARAYSIHDEDKPIQCFLIDVNHNHSSKKRGKKNQRRRRRGRQPNNDQNDSTEQQDYDDDLELPTVVCTSRPDEYAWFHGIPVDQMVRTDTVHAATLPGCREEASPRGVPEWTAELSAFW